jgi:hypothetical protein
MQPTFVKSEGTRLTRAPAETRAMFAEARKDVARA